MSQTYTLFVNFIEKRDDLLFQGESFFNSKIIDHLTITCQQIVITFTRTKKINIQTFLFTAMSPVRLQIYKAACFYLSVTGKLPPVNNVQIVTNGQTSIIDHERLTKSWADCQIQYLLKPDTANKCFTQNGKTCYIAMTYYLKAQLDIFPHDRFRIAWSGLNTLYNDLSDDRHESAKLNSLSQYLIAHPPVSAQEYIESLPDSFWKEINWYNYLQNHKLENTIKDLFVSNLYQDKIIYTFLGSCAIRQLYAEEKKTGESGRADQLKKAFDRKRENKKSQINERLRFLIIQYCYMLRNRSFHASKPYPLFELFDHVEHGTEMVLTRLLLLVIRDLLNGLR